METKIGKNAKDNDRLFDEAEDDDIWFHLNDYPSAHLWIKNQKLSKQDLYRIGLVLKKHSKYSKENGLSIMYTTKNNLRKTQKIGEIEVTGSVRYLRV